MMEVIRCNMCGKELSVRNDILMEDAIIISKKWGYFSKKDGETHRSFAVPVQREETAEYM